MELPVNVEMAAEWIEEVYDVIKRPTNRYYIKKKGGSE